MIWAFCKTSSRFSAVPSQKPFVIASSEVNVSTLPLSLIPFISTSGSTIAWAMSGLRWFFSAVARISERMYDWYLSGMISPFWLTTEAAPIDEPAAMYMLSHAMAISAPAEAALLLMNAMVGMGAFISSVRILSAASNSPPKVFSSSKI